MFGNFLIKVYYMHQQLLSKSWPSLSHVSSPLYASSYQLGLAVQNQLLFHFLGPMIISIIIFKLDNSGDNHCMSCVDYAKCDSI